MKSISLTACLIGLLFVLGLFLALETYAQEPTVEPSEAEPSGEINDLGLTDPPPAGFSVLYMFTGANNDTTPPDGVATAVHCTNFDTQAISLTLQFFLTGGSTVDSFTDNLASNETGSYSTSANTFFNETPLDLTLFEQGSGRVLATTSKVICTAQLIEPGAITPTFMVKLPLFDSNGNPIGGGGGPVFLPVILKQ